MQILTEVQENILKNERRLLNELRLALVEFGAPLEDRDPLSHSIEQLDELFLLVVVGEFNSGKSAFINALLGQRLLQEGVTPTTAQIHLLRYGPVQETSLVNAHQRVISLPAELLSEISIVDTPGTNAIIREHELITAQFIPRADLVLFITSSDRPFTESERQFMTQIRDWGKKVVVIINKVDILQSETDRVEVREFVTENARTLLGVTPDVFLVSARNALLAKQGQPALWKDSGFETLEAYIQERLDDQGRLRLKLLSPIGTGLSLASKYLEIIHSREFTLQKDFQMLTDVDAQLAVYVEDVKRDFRFRLSDVENALYELEQRGSRFFDDTFRLARLFDLMGKDRIQREFENQVVGDLPQVVEQKVNEIIDWMVGTQFRQWQAVVQHIAERRREHQEHIIGGVDPGSFNYDRERLMDAVGREARQVVETFDKDSESRNIAENAQLTVATSLAVEAGALGLGALVTILATTAAMDVTGIVSAGVVAALGLFIIPARRSSAKKELSRKITDLRDRLIGSLTSTIEKELARSTEQIREAIAPYSRFVRAEESKLTQAGEQYQGLHNQLEQLKAQIEEA